MNVLLYSTLGQPISTRCIFHGGSLLSFPLILFLSRHTPSAPTFLKHQHSVSWLPMHGSAQETVNRAAFLCRIPAGFVLRDLNWIVCPLHGKPGVRQYHAFSKKLKKKKKLRKRKPQPSPYTLWCRHCVQNNSKPRRIDCSGELITSCFIAFQQGKMKLLKFHLTRQPYELIVILRSVSIHRENNRLFFKWTNNNRKKKSWLKMGTDSLLC